MKRGSKRLPGPTGRVRASDETLLDMHPRALVRAFGRESPAFWALCFYVFIEYVRPQQVWPAIDVLPWGQLALIVATVATLLEPGVKRPLLAVDGWLAAFSAVLLASMMTAYFPAESRAELPIYVNWIVLYYLMTRIVSTERRYFLFLLLFFLWSLKMSQSGTRTFVTRGFQFASWGASGGGAWFRNSGEFAIQMCVFVGLSLPWVLSMRTRWRRWKTVLIGGVLPGTAIISLIASSSRGGQIGLAAVLLWLLAQTRHRVRGFAALAVVLPLLWLVMPTEQKARFETMGEDETSQTRLQYWTDGIEITKQHPVLGIGFNNWLPYYHRNYNPYGELPHNIFVEAGTELGFTGLTLFVVLIIVTFTMNASTRRLLVPDGLWTVPLRAIAYGLDAALVGFLASGFFVTVLFYPFFWVNLSMSATLHLIVRRRGSADRVRRRTPPRMHRHARGRPPSLAGVHEGIRRDAAPAPGGRSGL